MNADDFYYSRPLDEDDPVVTYSRVSTRRRPNRPVASARPVDDGVDESAFDAGEIRSAGRRDPGSLDFGAAGPYSGVSDSIEDFVEDTRRSNWLRYGFVGASLAVVAGVGILTATFGAATMIHGSPAPEAADTPALVLNSPDLEPKSGDATNGVREIAMPAGAPEETWRIDTVTPIPRPRPDDLAALPAPETAAPASEAETEATSTGNTQPATANAAVEVPVLQPPPAAKAQNTDDADSLISSIEHTLARVDANAAAKESPAAPMPEATPPAAPQTPQAASSADGPPMDWGGDPSYSPPADIAPPPYPETADPTYQITPPAPVGGYQTQSTGPVPPEPVPNVYPQAPQLQSSPSGAYPSDTYAFPPQTMDQTTTRRPGILRRTLARASDAVEKVFSRD